MKKNRRNAQVTDQEVHFNENEELVSTTDLRGIITYANDVFCRVAGYEAEELVGKNHNIVRHPDMPAPAFKDLWDHLKKGNSWRGVVKNRCKDGGFYWVDAYVTPVMENGEVTGYQSVRVKPSQSQKQKASQLYKAINQGKLSGISEVALSKKVAILIGLFAAFVAVLAYTSGMIAGALFALFSVLVFFIFRSEFMQIFQLANRLQLSFDSVSRFVYSGKGTAAVIDFHMGLMKARSRTILGRFVDLSHNLQGVGEALAGSTEQASLSMDQQKQELEQIATAMNEMAVTSGEIAQYSTQTLEKASETSQSCEQARALMSSNAQDINQLSNDVSTAAESAEALKQTIEKVNDMMNEINGIAEQTNLLALNAAIEAARAGEQGRGFAVVADEVRSLSTRTQSSSEDIQSSISEMVRTIEHWTKVMHDNIDNAKHCQKTATESSELIANVNMMMDELTDFSTHIATAAEQQGIVSEEINKNVQAVNDLGSLNVENTQTVKDNAEQISQAIDYIGQVSQTFKE